LLRSAVVSHGAYYLKSLCAFALKEKSVSRL
jgi:hypothetical protein